MSESTVTTPVAARLPNRTAAELKLLAAANGLTVSQLIASAVLDKLPELRAAA